MSTAQVRSRMSISSGEAVKIGGVINDLETIARTLQTLTSISCWFEFEDLCNCVCMSW